MRVGLLTHMGYSDYAGGAQKALRAACEGLALRGHRVTVFEHGPGPRCRRSRSETSSVCRGVRIAGPSASPVDLLREVAAERLDVIIVPCEDPWQRPVHLALRAGPPVAAVAQTPATLPVGPGSAYPDHRNAAALSRAATVLTSSRFLTDYVRQHSGVRALYCPLPSGGADLRPPALVGYRHRRGVLMVNPSVEKGTALLDALAAALPNVPFRVVPGWATTATDLGLLQQRRNIEVLPSREDLTPYLTSSRFLLVPSLWLENVPLIADEAMLHGLPVIASDVGGLREVTGGTADLLPVNTGTWMRGKGRARFVVGTQPVDAWRDVLRLRMGEPEEEWSRRSETAAATARNRREAADPAALETLLAVHA